MCRIGVFQRPTLPASNRQKVVIEDEDHDSKPRPSVSRQRSLASGLERREPVVLKFCF